MSRPTHETLIVEVKAVCKLCGRMITSGEYCEHCRLEARKIELLATLIAEKLKTLLGVR